MGGIGGLSVRVGGSGSGISGTKYCAESGSVFFVMMEVVVGWVENVWMSVCLYVCLVFSLNLQVFGGFDDLLESPSLS